VSIFSDRDIPRSLFPVPANLTNVDFSLESNGETDKADGFADDNSVGMILEENSLGSLKNTLVTFEGISGLKCNFEKTNVLPIGPVQQNINFVQELGFTVVPELSLS
jgi:hypothetical protein